MFRSISLLMVVLLVASPVFSSENYVTWSPDLKSGDEFSWHYITYESRVTDSEVNLTEGSVVSIKILKSPNSLHISNTSHIGVDLPILNVFAKVAGLNETNIDEYFELKIDSVLQDKNHLADTIYFYIFPLLFHTDLGDSNLLSENDAVTEHGSEYVYNEYFNYPDNFANITIHWDKSTGLMNYYDVVRQGFGFGSHIVVERDQSSSNSIGVVFFPSLVFSLFSLMIISRKIRKYQF